MCRHRLLQDLCDATLMSYPDEAHKGNLDRGFLVAGNEKTFPMGRGRLRASDTFDGKFCSRIQRMAGIRALDV